MQTTTASTVLYQRNDYYNDYDTDYYNDCYYDRNCNNRRIVNEYNDIKHGMVHGMGKIFISHENDYYIFILISQSS